MPHRARIFDYRFNYRHIHSNQIVLVDTSTFQLITHVHSISWSNIERYIGAFIPFVEHFNKSICGSSP